MTLTRQTLRGMWAGIPTPFDELGDLDTDRLSENVTRSCTVGLDGIYSTGGSGEFFALDFEEFCRMVDAFVPAAHRAGVPAQIGCSWTNTRGIIRRMRYAQRAGADAVMVAFPHWFTIAEPEVLTFFKDISTSCPGLPIVHYNSGRARRILHGADYRRLAEEVPELIGTKIISNDVLEWANLTSEAPDLAHFAAGEVNMAVSTMYGAVGHYSALIFVAPDLMLRLYRLCQEKHWAETTPIEKRIAAFFRDVVIPFARKGYTDSALDKAMAEISGLLLPFGAPRPPHRGLSPEDMTDMRSRFVESYPDFIYSLHA